MELGLMTSKNRLKLSKEKKLDDENRMTITKVLRFTPEELKLLAESEDETGEGFKIEDLSSSEFLLKNRDKLKIKSKTEEEVISIFAKVQNNKKLTTYENLNLINKKAS